MSFTIADLDNAIECIGWDYTYTHWKTKELVNAHATGWHELRDAIDYRGRSLDLPAVGTLTMTEQHGGMDQGSDYWYVFKVTDGSGVERLFKRNGWYASHDGGYYDGPTEEVRPVEKTVTVYETAYEAVA